MEYSVIKMQGIILLAILGFTLAAPSQRLDDSYTDCLLLVDEVRTFVSKQATQTSIVDYLNRSCSDFDGDTKAVCRALADLYPRKLFETVAAHLCKESEPKILDAIKNGIHPEVACKLVAKCVVFPLYVRSIQQGPPPYNDACHCLLNNRYQFVRQNDQFNSNINKGLEYFYILPDSGLIYLSDRLTSDPTADTRYTASTESYKSTSQDQQAKLDLNTTDYQYQVKNNFNTPVFIVPLYSVVIPENTAVGACILKVTATKKDVTYTSHAETDTLEFFFLTLSGDVCVRKSLYFVKNTTVYIMVITATDNQYPARNATAVAVIHVERNDQPLTSIDVTTRDTNKTVMNQANNSTRQYKDTHLNMNLTVHVIRNLNGQIVLYQESNDTDIIRNQDLVHRAPDKITISADDGEHMVTVKTSTETVTVQRNPARSLFLETNVTTLSDGKFEAGSEKQHVPVENIKINVIRNPNPPRFLDQESNGTYFKRNQDQAMNQTKNSTSQYMESFLTVYIIRNLIGPNFHDQESNDTDIKRNQHQIQTSG